MDFSAKPSALRMRRILAVWLPRFSTDRLKRKDASLSKLISGSGAPLVIAGRANNSLYIAALEDRAQRLGLYKGQPLANARAMAPALTVRPTEEKEDAALLERMAEWCDRFSPFVAGDSPDGLVLDISGAAHLFGGEAAMLNLVTQKIAAQGFAVNPRAIHEDVQLLRLPSGARHIDLHHILAIGGEIAANRKAAARAVRKVVDSFVLRMLGVKLIDIDQHRHLRIAHDEAADLVRGFNIALHRAG